MISKRTKDVRENRLQIYNKAMELRGDGLNNKKILEKLDALGFRVGNGRQIDQSTLSRIMNRRYFVGNMGKLKSLKYRRKSGVVRLPVETMQSVVSAAPKKLPTSRSSDAIDIITMVMASNLPETAKIRIVKALLNES